MQKWTFRNVMFHHTVHRAKIFVNLAKSVINLSQSFFRLDEQGEFKTLAYNDQTRSPYMNVPVEEVNKIYQALKKFNEFLYRKENFIDYKLQPGNEIDLMINSKYGTYNRPLFV